MIARAVDNAAPRAADNAATPALPCVQAVLLTAAEDCQQQTSHRHTDTRRGTPHAACP